MSENRPDDPPARPPFVSLSDGDFRVCATEVDAQPAVSTSTAETELATAGYKLAEADQGRSGGGWIAFTARHHRPVGAEADKPGPDGAQRRCISKRASVLITAAHIA